ncbi:hypothetical protein PIB30_083441 [Stylosanthes scabra]|uniref:Uncharacterized protein n=1 Tax=Stylosanthes scabra TaxID=79078 RepID=A0ABU6TST7_9FABA|nr:hypothetical protein [Stylosanthes scabra]
MQLSTTLPNAFPSNTVVNPTIECYAITIRNGEALQDSKQEGLNKEDVKGTPTKPPKEEIVINAIQCLEEEDEEWCMRMDVIQGLNREVQQEEAMQEFQAKQGRYDVLDDTNLDFVMQELDAIVQKNIAEMQQEHLELQPPRVDEVQPNNVKEAWRRMVHQLRKIEALMIRDWKDSLQGDKAASNTLNIEESQAAEFCSKQ